MQYRRYSLLLVMAVLATWVIRSEKGIKYWEKTSIVSGKVNKQLSISSCLNLFTKQMDRGDKFLSQELIFRTDDPSSQHRLRMRIGAALQQKHMVPSSVVSPSWEP